MDSAATISQLISRKKTGPKITMLTAYDYPLALILDEAGVDIVLVGDSLANVALGLESTTQVGMEVMLHHARAVSRGVKRALVVGDMPFEGYQLAVSDAVTNAKRFINEAGCQAVKLEWFDRCLEVVREIRLAGIPVMGHVGLTPQTAEKLGGFKVQGKDEGSALKIVDAALALEKAGCFALVLECVPTGLAQEITAGLSIPTIGIGAGPHCDGQVLVTQDMLGLYDRVHPKFVKLYADLKADIHSAVQRYIEEVDSGDFPGPGQTFH
jgi:3-methyl-2-oxobutanoate hydroxymethyltransferase